MTFQIRASTWIWAVVRDRLCGRCWIEKKARTLFTPKLIWCGTPHCWPQKNTLNLGLTRNASELLSESMIHCNDNLYINLIVVWPCWLSRLEGAPYSQPEWSQKSLASLTHHTSVLFMLESKQASFRYEILWIVLQGRPSVPIRLKRTMGTISCHFRERWLSAWSPMS